ncbi:hypothetical protein GCM10020331_036860 [Ectobacillus funiculus]
MPFSSAIGAEMLLPIYMQSTRGTSAFESGLLLLPGAIAMGIMSPIAGRIFDTYGARPLATIGMSIVVVTTIPLWLFISTHFFYFHMRDVYGADGRCFDAAYARKYSGIK